MVDVILMHSLGQQVQDDFVCFHEMPLRGVVSVLTVKVHVKEGSRLFCRVRSLTTQLGVPELRSTRYLRED